MEWYFSAGVGFTRKNPDDRSCPDNGRVHDLFRSRSCPVIERWNWFQFGHTLQSSANGGGYLADRSPAVLRLNYWHPIGPTHSPIYPSPFSRTVATRRAPHGHPLSFFPVSPAVTLRPVTNDVDLASRAIWVTALLEPTGRSLTKRIDSGCPMSPTRFWGNHVDDATKPRSKRYNEPSKSLYGNLLFFRWAFLAGAT